MIANRMPLNQAWLCKVKLDVLFMQLPPQSPWSPYVLFRGDEKPGWGVLFHHLSYFTLLVPSGSCSLSFFSHGWLIAQLLSHSLCSFTKSPLSFNSPPLCLLRFFWVTRSKDAPLVEPSLWYSLLKNNRCSRAWRGQVVWWAMCLNLPVAGISPLCPQTSNMLPLPHPSLSLSKPTHPVCACPTIYMYHCTCSTTATCYSNLKVQSPLLPIGCIFWGL